MFLSEYEKLAVPSHTKAAKSPKQAKLFLTSNLTLAYCNQELDEALKDSMRVVMKL